MAKEQSSLTSRALEWLKGLAGIRDAFLVLAGFSYVLGFVTWALNAKVNNLGPLPAIDSQYFIAGIVPLVILFLVYGGIKGGVRISGWYFRWFRRDFSGWKLRLGRGIYFGLLGSFVGLVLLFMLVDRFPQLRPAMFIFLGLFLVNLLLLPDLGFSRALVIWRALILSVSVVYLGGAVVALYIFGAYPNLPQEFGGVRPRCGFLDVVKSQVSNATLERLLPNDAIGTDTEVVRSTQVDILYSGGDVMLVRPYLEGEADSRTYEIRKDVIQAVVSCHQDQTSSTPTEVSRWLSSVSPSSPRKSENSALPKEAP